MRRHGAARIVIFLVFAAFAVLAVGAVVMQLWNWLLPDLFGWHAIGLGQALGLLLLSRILVGGFRGGTAMRSHWRGRMTERWAQMSAEERASFRAGLARRCGGGEVM